MKTIVSVIGSNATGKSTRINKLVDYLDQSGLTYSDVIYEFTKNGEQKTVKSGRRYENGVFILGNKTKTGGWVGADYVLGKLGDKATIYQFMNVILESSDTMIIEGYFAVGGAGMRPQALRDNLNYDIQCAQYYFLYNELQEYIDRTESRSGKTWESRGKDPEKSAGWKSNISYWKGLKKAQEQEIEGRDLVGTVNPYIKEDFFIEEYNNYIKCGNICEPCI